METMEVKIKTKLIYFFDDQFQEMSELACKAIREHWGIDAETKGSLSDLIIWILQNREHAPMIIPTFNRGRHNKTMLLYFSEQEHKVYTKYLNVFIIKHLANGGCKKQAQTQFIFNLLKEYIG